MKVAKFGGSSVANADMLEKVANIIKDDPKRKFIVVSAPGKRFEDDIKVTDLFIQLGEKYTSGQEIDEILNKITDRFLSITQDLELNGEVVQRIKDETKRLLNDTKEESNLKDSLKAMGEDSLARVLSAYLNKIGLKASYVNPRDAGIFVSDEPGEAQILDMSYEKIYQLRKREGIIVIPGFYGYTEKGVLMTFPRGGSDITGSIIAAGIDAELYENFTDVSSVYCVNPTIIDDPKEIKSLTYREMRELSYAGFSVFHDEALIPAFNQNIPVCIKNTNEPQKPGTMISAEKQHHNGPIVGIASDKGFSSIYVGKYLMNRELGFGKGLLNILVEEDISFEHAPSGIDSMSVIVRSDQLNKGKEQRVIKRIKEELQVDTISISHGLGIIMIVGEGMSSRVNVAAIATTAIAKAGVNIEMINQGSSDVSMMFGMQETDINRAVQMLYHDFIELSEF
ncbi:aspartate kinase [Tenuibacillus multivorans]|uniref:Aspartokinase n=1 Tax=Tenuibacillus multivorans TaxID=237069 RepID=A0A1G9Z6F0_9BACI|nr:aspartate kinase [Tenuibacillus multivorans]GEL77385.1 aspartokinase 3 [Tenuibacillus multivorans]SDN16820.1 aspartate kinase [Tenuibacillus multivorans]